MRWPEPVDLAAIIGAIGVTLGGWLTWLASGSSQLRNRVSELETKYLDIWTAREKDALIKRAQGDHIDLLEHYIWTGTPPPPPPRPPDV